MIYRGPSRKKSGVCVECTEIGALLIPRQTSEYEGSDDSRTEESTAVARIIDECERET